MTSIEELIGWLSQKPLHEIYLWGILIVGVPLSTITTVLCYKTDYEGGFLAYSILGILPEKRDVLFYIITSSIFWPFSLWFLITQLVLTIAGIIIVGPFLLIKAICDTICDFWDWLFGRRY